ncbi:MAG: carboxypeptidase-like regulatory domain-containing protein [Planctomycetota bacterium]
MLMFMILLATCGCDRVIVVKGTVTDKDLVPIHDVKVSLATIDGRQLCNPTTTDENGIFLLDCIGGTSRFFLFAEKPGYDILEKEMENPSPQAETNLVLYKTQTGTPND